MYRLLKSRGFAERVVQRLGLANQLGLDSGGIEPEGGETDQAVLAGLARRLLGRIKVEPIQGTELVTLSFVSSQPEQAAGGRECCPEPCGNLRWTCTGRGIREARCRRKIRRAQARAGCASQR